MADWTPALTDDAGPLYERLIAALRRDIAAGALAPGARLPPQRDLAHRLGLGLGTVTRAYVEAERQGLVVAQVGRGSFVAGGVAARAPEATAPDTINLSQNIAPTGPAAARISDTLARLRRRGDLAEHVAYAPSAGLEVQRRAAAAWLARSAGLETADPARLICCAGAQQALALTLSTLCRPGDTVLCEAATFPGIKALAEQLGLSLIGVAMDAQGLLPEALDRAAAAGARVVSLMPTLQNPTARIMSPARRGQIVAVARKHDLWIVEDDIYAVFARPNSGGDGDAGPTPLAVLAPERTFYVSGVSKSLAPGLRVGFVMAPSAEQFERLLRTVRALSYAPPNFGGLIATQWIEDGTADAIAGEIRAEMAARLALARSILGPAIESPRAAASPHVWLPMTELEAEKVAGRALRGGVELTPPASPIVDGGLIGGVRLCLGAVPDRATLERGLLTVRSALSAEVEDRSRAVI